MSVMMLDCQERHRHHVAKRFDRERHSAQCGSGGWRNLQEARQDKERKYFELLAGDRYGRGCIGDWRKME